MRHTGCKYNCEKPLFIKANIILRHFSSIHIYHILIATFTFLLFYMLNKIHVVNWTLEFLGFSCLHEDEKCKFGYGLCQASGFIHCNHNFQNSDSWLSLLLKMYVYLCPLRKLGKWILCVFQKTVSHRFIFKQSNLYMCYIV